MFQVQVLSCFTQKCFHLAIPIVIGSRGAKFLFSFFVTLRHEGSPQETPQSAFNLCRASCGDPSSVRMTNFMVALVKNARVKKTFRLRDFARLKKTFSASLRETSANLCVKTVTLQPLKTTIKL